MYISPPFKVAVKIIEKDSIRVGVDHRNRQTENRLFFCRQQIITELKLDALCLCPATIKQITGPTTTGCRKVSPKQVGVVIEIDYRLTDQCVFSVAHTKLIVCAFFRVGIFF